MSRTTRKKHKKKNCGSCDWFKKIKNNDRIPGSGLCEFDDCIVKTDYGSKCNNWKGIKYNRKENERISYDTKESMWKMYC